MKARTARRPEWIRTVFGFGYAFDGDEVRLGEVKLTYRRPAETPVSRTKSAS